MNLAVGARTDVGQIREANEDSYLVEDRLFVVADGMGGHVAGDIASSTAVEVIAGNASTASADDPQSLAALLRRANKAIWEKARRDPNLHGMGTTCTLIFFDQERAHVAHVGDSRAYLLRDGQLRQLTEDHTLVARMVKEGRLREEEAEHHPQRNIITRTLGVESDVDVDMDSLELRVGDRFMLCSDGLSSIASGQDITRILQKEADPQAAADALVDLANAAGGEDNVTVVVLDVTDQPVAERAIPPTQEPAKPAEVPTRRGSWRKRVAIAVAVLAVMGFGGYLGISYLLDNSWYVGASDDGAITIYNGIPEEVFGFSFRDSLEVSELTLADLPPNLRENFREGRKADSLTEAHAIVADLQQRAEEFQETRPDQTTPSPEPEPDKTPRRDQRRDRPRRDGRR